MQGRFVGASRPPIFNWFTGRSNRLVSILYLREDEDILRSSWKHRIHSLSQKNAGKVSETFVQHSPQRFAIDGTD